MLRYKLWGLAVVMLVGVSASCLADSAQKVPSGLIVEKGIKFVKGAGARTALAGTSKVALPFTDNCEGTFPGQWAPFNDPHFGPTTYKHVSGLKSYYCAQAGAGAVAAPGPYPTGFTGWITYGPFSLAGATSGQVTFKLWNNSEANYDKVFAGWSLDDDIYEGTSWTGSTNGWITATVNMANAGYDDTYLGKSAVYFSFYFKSDGSTTAEGAYLDDIAIAATSSNGGVKGTTKTAGGMAIPGALITAGSSSTTSSLTGQYTLKVPPGTYTVKATKSGWAFTPASKSVTVGSALVTTNFVGKSTIGGITGVVKTGTGAVVKGAVVTAGTKFVYTDASGKYFLQLSAGTYSVNVKKPGYKFTPASTSVTVAKAMVTKNFTAAKWTGNGVVNRWAVSVGIATFQNINNLTYCDDDARDVTAALKAGGFPAANIRQLIDSQATKAGIKSAIAWMASKADADDVCVFFQSSHGDQGPDVPPYDEASADDEYLCPYDTGSSRTTEIRDDELGQWLAALKTTKYVVLIDACYAGGLIKSAGAARGGGFGAGFARAINGMTAPGEMTTKDLDDLGSGVVIASCTDLELSEESGALQNGVFAYYLVQGMNNGKADANKNGWYSAEEVFNYSKGPAHTYNPEQTLVIYDGYVGQLDFAKAKATATPGLLAISGAAAATKSGSTAIMVSLSTPASVTASILNLAGREVALLGSKDLDKGTSTLLWSGKSKLGTTVPAGQYFVRLQAKDASGNNAACLLSLRK